MKRTASLIIFALLLLVPTASKNLTAANLPGTSADFVGTWRGNEQCQGVSAPVAVIAIVADGPTAVFLTGVYSVQGKIKGEVKNNIITIPSQEVADPNFKNLKIEGSLTLGKSHRTLTGVFIVLNNDTRDNCTVNYHR